MLCPVLLVDDHPMLTRGLATLIDQEPDMRVDGQFSCGSQLLTFLGASAEPPAQVVLLDLHLPAPHDGLSLLPRLRREWPRLRVLVYSSAASAPLVRRAAEAGAHGFLDKSVDADVLLAGIQAVHRGELVFPAYVRRASLASAGEAAAGPDQDLLGLQQLSAREREIVGLLREGLRTRAIAVRLSISEQTVSTHRRNIMHKLNLSGVAEVIRFAHEHGL